MQKALDQMNLKIHHVISDLAGTSGLAIMDAILGGNAIHISWPDYVIVIFRPVKKPS